MKSELKWFVGIARLIDGKEDEAPTIPVPEGRELRPEDPKDALWIGEVTGAQQ